MAKPASETAEFSAPVKTPYADAYRELIHITETNHIELVLANFSMAVNPDSDPDVIQFYRAGFPAIYSQIKANQTHSRLVEDLAHENPGICFVNTHPGLDGAHHNFIDLMHFNKSGEEKMAETFFSAIQPILERTQVSAF
jgi:hypothetical protein